MEIQSISAFKDNYIWAMINENNRTACVVDPGDAAPVIEFLNQHQFILKTILITHKHQDHCGGVKVLQEKYQPEIIGPQHDDILTTQTVKDAEHVFITDLNLTFRVMEIPGHTLEHVAFYCEAEKILFCGDTLFSVGCGRVFEGTYEQMWHSLEKILALPNDTKIYCGHEYTEANLKFAKAVEPENHDRDIYSEKVTDLIKNNQPTLPATLMLEKKINPFLRASEPTIIKNLELKTGLKFTDPVDVFAEMRQWKNQF